MKYLSTLVRDLWNHFGYKLVYVLFIMISVGIIEGLSVTLLLPLLISLGLEEVASSGGGLIQKLFDINPSFFADWVGVTILIISVSVLQGLLVALQGWYVAKLTQRYMALWKMSLLQGFLGAEWQYLAKKNSGELISAITNETGRLQAATMSVFGIAATFVVGVAYLGYGLAISTSVTVLMVCCSIVLVVSLSGLYRMSAKAGRRIGPLMAIQQSLISEFIRGAKTVKAATMENRAARRVEAVVKDLEKEGAIAAYIPSLVRGSFESIGVIILLLLLISAVKLLGVPLADLLVVLALFVRLFPRLSSFQQYLHSLNAYAPSIDTLVSLKSEANIEREKNAKFAHCLPIPEEGPTELRFKGLSVSHEKRKVLGPINLSISLKGCTAIVGESGAGKSTLMASILRLYPYEGDILIDDIPINKLSLVKWRRCLGYVPQDPMYFHASIRDNLTIACPDASDEQLWDALKIASLKEFVDGLPRGCDTVIGDQGTRMSGGQLQRLGLARAILAQPRILLLDEATSALDSVTEELVLSNLVKMRRSMPIILVAHRPTTMRIADNILVLHEGRVSDTGGWSELIKRNKLFVKLSKGHG